MDTSPAPITTDLVWQTVEGQIFGALGFVTASGEARTAGIVYTVVDRKLYVGTGRDAWKTRHIRANPRVSLTVTVAKRIPFVPWIKIPPATITFQGSAEVREISEVPEAVTRKLLGGLDMPEEAVAEQCMLEIVPHGDFVTYGVGVSLATMRKPLLAAGRAPV